jgi:hypothetical protein
MMALGYRIQRRLLDEEEQIMVESERGEDSLSTTRFKGWRLSPQRFGWFTVDTDGREREREG